MSNYRQNGPGAEQRPRDQGWGARRDQHREPYPRQHPGWNPPSGEPSGEGRRNDFNHSRPAGNRPDFPSSGQYIPLSRRNQYDVDRRPDLRSEADTRSFRPAAPGVPFGPGPRHPPTAPRDQIPVQDNGRGEAGNLSRRRDAKIDRNMQPITGPERSRWVFFPVVLPNKC